MKQTNKVILNDEVLIDLTEDTATPSSVREGKTFHGRDGIVYEGTLQNKVSPIVDKTITKITAEDLEGVTNIGENAFRDCKRLINIEIPDTVTGIENYAFWGCTELKDIIIPDSVVDIGNSVFCDCIGLTNIKLSNNITSIPSGIFGNCSGLINIEIPAGITHIGVQAFSGCKSLASITVPDTITHIGEWAFYLCSNLTDIYYAGSKEEWMQISIAEGNDALYSATIHYGKPSEPIGYEGLDYVSNGDGTCYVAGRGTCTHSEIVVPETSPAGDVVTAIRYNAFYDFLNQQGDQFLTSITLPDTVTNIGQQAFRQCSNLISIHLGNNIKTIEFEAFRGCISLTSIQLPETLTEIGVDSFAGTGLQEINIPASLTTIGLRAFTANSNLIKKIEVDLNNPVYYSFGNCLIERDTGAVLLGCTNSTIPNDGSIKTISQYAFYRAEFSEINIPEGVVTIEHQVFGSCANLTKVTIPTTMRTIGVSAFLGTNITDVYYNASITEWSKISIDLYNDKLTNANIHYIVEKPTTIFYAKDLLTTVNSGMDLDAVVTDNNYITYTYITYTPGSNDPYYYPFMNVLGDRYLSICLRTTTATGAWIQFYIGSSGGGPQNDDTMMKAQIAPAAADGNWHTVVFDLQPLIDAGHYNGKNISYFRFDVLDAQGGAMPAGASIDIKYIAFFETENGANQPDEAFFEPNSTEAFVASASTAFKYCGHIDYINFQRHSLDGYRDDSSGTAVIHPAIVDGISAVGHPDPALAGRKVIILTGWALVNGGQDKYFWSVDGQNWTEATAGYYGITGAAHAGAAGAYGVTSVQPANGVFTNMVIDLTDYAGQTKDVYVAVRSTTTAGTPAAQKICHFLTFTNCTIPN